MANLEIDEQYVHLVSMQELSVERLERARESFNQTYQELQLLKNIIERTKNTTKQRVLKSELNTLLGIVEKHRELWVLANMELQEAEYRHNYAKEQLSSYEMQNN